MPVEFPTLTSSAVGQYPSHVTLRFKSVVNEYLDGSRQAFSISQGVCLGWRYNLRGLSDSEKMTLETAYRQYQYAPQSLVAISPDDLLVRPAHWIGDLRVSLDEEGQYSTSIELEERK